MIVKNKKKLYQLSIYGYIFTIIVIFYYYNYYLLLKDYASDENYIEDILFKLLNKRGVINLGGKSQTIFDFVKNIKFFVPFA